MASSGEAIVVESVDDDVPGPQECRVCFGGSDLLVGTCSCSGTSKYICQSCMVACATDDPASDNWVKCSTCKAEYSHASMKTQSAEWLKCIRLHQGPVQCVTRYDATMVYLRTSADNFDPSVCTFEYSDVCAPGCIIHKITDIEVMSATAIRSMEQGRSDWESKYKTVVEDLMMMYDQYPTSQLASAYETGARLMAKTPAVLSVKAFQLCIGFQDIAVSMLEAVYGKTSIIYFRARLTLQRYHCAVGIDYCSDDLIGVLVSALGETHPFTKRARETKAKSRTGGVWVHRLSGIDQQG